MWGVDPALMCDRHLLGEHAELHQLVGTIERHPHGDAIVEGHGRRGNIDTSRIATRHAALVREMHARGFSHESPMEYDDHLNQGSIDEAANRQLLADRCVACRTRIERAQTGSGGTS